MPRFGERAIEGCDRRPIRRREPFGVRAKAVEDRSAEAARIDRATRGRDVTLAPP